MKSKFPSLDLPDGELIADASVLINFLGTGIVETLLVNLGRPLIMADEAMAEIRRHPFPDMDLSASMGILGKRGLVHVAQLQARTTFYELTANDLTGGLDDGEAATIALAIERSNNAVVVLDERKASRIFAERWPARSCASTVMLLAQPQVRGSLTAEDFVQACCNALRHAKMRVPAEAISWMVEVIGAEKARSFASLAKGYAKAARDTGA